MICIFVIMLCVWCRMRMRPARLVSNAFLYTTHVSDTCLLHEINVMGRYVTTTYRPHKLHLYVLGRYVSTTYT